MVKGKLPAPTDTASEVTTEEPVIAPAPQPTTEVVDAELEAMKAEFPKARVSRLPSGNLCVDF